MERLILLGFFSVHTLKIMYIMLNALTFIIIMPFYLCNRQQVCLLLHLPPSNPSYFYPVISENLEFIHH